MVSSMTWILLAALAPCVRSFPSGATQDTCLSMRPNHGVPAQLSASPFSVMPSTNKIPQGRSLDVYITAKSGETRNFHGYMLQARAQGTTTTIGEWVNIPWDAKKIKCGVTHRNPAGRKLSKFTWEAPAKFSGIVEFVATVVHAKAEFWMNIRFPVMVEGPSTLPPVTAPRTTPTTTFTTITTTSTTTTTTTPTTTSSTTSSTTTTPTTTTKTPTTTTSITSSAATPETSLTTPSTSRTTAGPVVTTEEQSSVVSTVKAASKAAISLTTSETVTTTEASVTTKKTPTGSNLGSEVTTESTSPKPGIASQQPQKTSETPSGTSEQPDVTSQQLNGTTLPPEVTSQQPKDSDESTEDATKSAGVTDSAEVSDGTPKQSDVTSSPSEVPSGRTDVGTQSSRFTTQISTPSTTAKPQTPKTNVNLANVHDRDDNCNTGAMLSLQTYLALGAVLVATL